MALGFSSSKEWEFLPGCEGGRGSGSLVEGQWRAPGSAWKTGRWGRAEHCRKAPALALTAAPGLAPSPTPALTPACNTWAAALSPALSPVLSTGGGSVFSAEPLTLERTLRRCSVASNGQQL